MEGIFITSSFERAGSAMNSAIDDQAIRRVLESAGVESRQLNSRVGSAVILMFFGTDS
jgi:hypothetical protein